MRSVLPTREGNQLFQIDLKLGRIRHEAVTGAAGFTGNGGPALNATLSGPKGLAADAEGHVWLVDTESHSIRRYDAATGTLNLMAGTGKKGDGPDGDPLQCAMNRPHGIWVDRDGAVWITDRESHKIRVMRRVNRWMLFPFGRLQDAKETHLPRRKPFPDFTAKCIAPFSSERCGLQKMIQKPLDRHVCQVLGDHPLKIVTAGFGQTFDEFRV
jgi:hypothetical protein